MSAPLLSWRAVFFRWITGPHRCTRRAAVQHARIAREIGDIGACLP